MQAMMGVGAVQVDLKGVVTCGNGSSAPSPTLDGSDEGKDRNLGVRFDCFHEDGDGDDHFDAAHLERWRAADTFLPPRVARRARKEQFF